MKRNRLFYGAVLACAVSVGAEATIIGDIIDQDGGYAELLQTQIATGATTANWAGHWQYDGIRVPAQDDFWQDKNYTAQVVQLGNADEIDESYLEEMGFLGKFFASSTADGAGNLQVGADAKSGASRSLSRFNLTIKNRRSRPLLMNFAYDIPEGQVATIDPARYPWMDSRRSHAHVHAHIEALLKAPDEEMGGTWVETTHSLFDFFVDMEGSCKPNEFPCTGVFLQYSASAVPHISNMNHDHARSTFGIDIAAFSGLVALPEIPPYGELTVYYDMFALGFGYMEGGARAFLGDPLGLSGGNGIRLFEVFPGDSGDPVGVPEPTTLSMLGAGLLFLGVRRRKGVMRAARKV